MAHAVSASRESPVRLTATVLGATFSRVWVISSSSLVVLLKMGVRLQ